jgi:3-phosphoshikimate 1-carboxyvinyltransferase
LIGETIEVHPGPPLSGVFQPPGDKSITHRAYLLALLARGRSVIENPNPGADCESTRRCVELLGAASKRENDAVVFEGAGFELREPDRILDCGNSGTTLRLLAGIVAAQPFTSVLAGDHSLARRPVDRVIAPLTRMGATLLARANDRLPPLIVRGGTLRAITYEVPVASAQIASCVLLAALQTAGETTVTLPGPARDHTERMLMHRGVPLEVEPLAHGGRRVRLRGPAPFEAARVRVPGDASAAAFFFAVAAATPGSSVTASGLSLNPTRSAFLDVLERMGAQVTRTRTREEGGEPVGDVTVAGATLSGAEIPKEWVPRLIDEIPAWSVAATYARGRSRVTGASELRAKESDRIATLVTRLARLGVRARELEDGLEIEGGPVNEGDVDAAGDHRIAMAFAALGTRASGPIRVRDAGNVATSFPAFEETLIHLGGRVGGGGASR